MSRIVITGFMGERAMAQLATQHDVLYDPKLVDDRLRMQAEAASADAIIVRNRTQVRGELLAALAHCSVVSRLGVGLDNIDLAACEARGIKVIPAIGGKTLGLLGFGLIGPLTARLARGAGHDGDRVRFDARCRLPEAAAHAEHRRRVGRAE